jgi:oligoendopeptidase F
MLLAKLESSDMLQEPEALARQRARLPPAPALRRDREGAARALGHRQKRLGAAVRREHVRLRFPFRGEELTSAQIFDKMSAKDREVRRDAATAISAVLAKNIRLCSRITNTIVKDKAIEDGWRKFAKPISSRNLANQVEDEVVEALITAVRDAYPRLSHRYYALKARWMGLDKLEFWDRNAPLPEDSDQRRSWDDAKVVVLDAYRSFSPKLAELVDRFFVRNWIDAELRPGKDSGAFCHPVVPSVHPYVLMNFQGKSRDVMTLAHELGHGVHQLLAAKQGLLMAGTPLTLAETASVFGEQLTFRVLLGQAKSAVERRVLLASKVEDMLNTVVRQIAFCEFERRVHDARKEAELTPDDLGDIWMTVQQESLGPAFNYPDEYRTYWSYIPHFVHVPFYVYAYAFGDCLVNALYKRYEETPEGFEQRYLAMLEAGGTLRHKELLAPFGLDASDPAFWAGGLEVLEGYIAELEQALDADATGAGSHGSTSLSDRPDRPAGPPAGPPAGSEVAIRKARSAAAFAATPRFRARLVLRPRASPGDG